MFYFFTLHLKSYYSFLKYSTMESFRGFLFFSNAFDQSLKDPQRKRPEFWENSLMERLECVYSLNSKKYVVICLLENKIFNSSSKTIQHILLKLLKLVVLIMPFCSLTLYKQLFEKGFLKNFANFTGKHLCRSHFFIKKAPRQVFSCEIFDSFKNTFLQNTSGGCFWPCSYERFTLG